MTDVELVLDAKARLGEGAVWDHRLGVLRWVDILRHEVHTLDPATGGDASVALPGAVGAVALRGSGGLVAAVQGGFFGVDPDSGHHARLAPVDDHGGDIRMNDGDVDPRGRFWAGTMHVSGQVAVGSLHVLHGDRSVTTAVTGVTVSNGLVWPDDTGTTALYVDTPTRRVDRLEVDADTATVVARRAFATIDTGHPDGMTGDAEGGVWVALWGGWGVQRFDAAGRPDVVITVPAAQVTSVAFGGDDLRDLYITTAADGLGASDLRDQPHAGGVFRCRPGVVGRPAHVAVA